MSFLKYFLFALLLLISSASHGGLIYDNIQWQTLTTKHFLIHHPKQLEKTARKAGEIAEHVFKETTRKIGHQPNGITHLVILDQFDLPNGFATFLPKRQMTIFVTPPYYVSSLEDYDDWLETVILHEYVHILHLDFVTGIPKTVRQIFGNLPLFYPHAFQPLYLIEGLATYHETNLKKGIGRGQNAYFNMLMRMEVTHGIKSISQVNIDTVNWPGGTTPYLYGVNFYQFIEKKYGIQAMDEYIRKYSDNLIPFMLNSTSRSTYRKNYSELWKEYQIYLHEKYSKQINLIKKSPLVTGKQITDIGETNDQPHVLADSSIIFFSNDGYNQPSIVKFINGKSQRLRKIHPLARIDVHEQSGILIAQPDVWKNNKFYYDIYRMNLNGRSYKRLTRGKRYIFAVWNKDASKILAIHNSMGKNSLHILDSNGKLLNILWTGKNGETLAYPDWSKDETHLLASVFRPSIGWNMEMFNLTNQKWSKLPLETGINLQGKYSKDEKSIIYTSENNGVYNIKRYDLGTQKIVNLSNLIGGGFSPTEAPDGSIFYSGLGKKGFDIFKLSKPNKIKLHPINKSNIRTAKKPNNYPLHKGKSKPYQAFAYLKPNWWLPILADDGIQSTYGIQTFISDPLQRHQVNFLGSYDFNNHETGIDLYYFYDRWPPILVGGYSRDPIYTKKNESLIRLDRSETAQLNIILPKIAYKRVFSLHLGLIRYKEHNVIKQATSPFIPDFYQSIAGTAITHNSAKQFRYSMNPMQGRKVRLIYETDELLKNNIYSGEFFKLDWREYKSLSARNSINFRILRTWSSGNTRKTRLGGETIRQNSVFDGQDAELVFNKRDISLRGYPLGLDELTGNNAFMTSIEWRWPIANIERSLMTPPVGVHTISGSLFFDAGDAWDIGDGPNTLYRSVGIEIKSTFSIGYFIRLPVRIAYVKPLDLNQEASTYIQVGGSF